MLLVETLRLPRCPHCSVDSPNLNVIGQMFNTHDDSMTNKRFWKNYKCQRCGGVVIAASRYPDSPNNNVIEFYPAMGTISADLPSKVKQLLKEATESTFTPNGSIMTCASAVDEMLKQKSYRNGSLYTRIDQAKVDGLLSARYVYLGS